MSASVLVPFSIDPGALSEHKGKPSWPAHLRRVLETWRENGVLMLPESEINASSLLSAVKGLSGDSRRLWELALVQGKFRIAVGQADAVAASGLPDGVSPLARVIAIRESLAVDAIRRTHEEQEVATLDVVDQCTAFGVARKLGRDSLQEGANVRDEWEARVKPLLSYAQRRITLVDRYAVSSAWDHRRRGAFAETGLGRFLKDAAGNGNGASIEFFAADADRRAGTMFSELWACADQVLGANRRRIRAFRVPDDVWKRHVHYRGLLVDDNTCLKLDYGIQAFDNAVVGKLCDVTLGHPDSLTGGELLALRRGADQELV